MYYAGHLVEHHEPGRHRHRDRRARGRRHRRHRERVPLHRAARHRSARSPARAAQRCCESTRLVGRPVFFSMAIILLAFVPVFALTGQEGKLFHPLAFTKTFAVLAATVIAVTLVPVLCTLLLGGRMHAEEANPVMRAAAARLPARRSRRRCRTAATDARRRGAPVRRRAARWPAASAASSCRR